MTLDLISVCRQANPTSFATVTVKKPVGVFKGRGNLRSKLPKPKTISIQITISLPLRGHHHMDLIKLQNSLGHTFNKPKLLERALTRKAHALEQQEQGRSMEDQETFRTLGDAVLHLVLMHKFYELGYDTREKMTNKNSELGREESLAKISTELGVGPNIQLGTGEKRQNADKEPKVLAETLEAIIAAIFLDTKYDESKEIIIKWFDL